MTKVDQHVGWNVDHRCINCGASRAFAPGLIVERSGRSTFARQPQSFAEQQLAWRAAISCPTASVLAPVGTKAPPHTLPEELAPGVFRLGFNSRTSWGAHAFAFASQQGICMVDSPRWSSALIAWLGEKGGLAHILLTHRDDVADAAKYANHFGARVWIHENDRDGAPFATDLLKGATPTLPLDGVAVLFTPGHTSGSVMFLWRDTLFTGDSLAWDYPTSRLIAFREACWFDWPTQVRSLEMLTAHRFDRVLAGHGGSITLDAAAMQTQLQMLLAAINAPAHA